MVWSNIHFLPIISFLILPGTFVTTYCIAIYKNDVTILFPYISDTGNKVPESCIFSQFVNLSAFLFMFTIYIRYKQVEQFYRDHLSAENAKMFTVNYVSFVVGIISCLGLTIVANFQEIYLRVIHLTGAMMCFSCGLIYCILQTWISHRGQPLLNTLVIAKIRFCLTWLMFTTFMIAVILGPYAISIYDGKDRTKWQPNERGYTHHAIAAFCEWITMFCLNFFLLSYTHEMQDLTVSSPKVFITNYNVNLMASNQNDNENSFYQNDEHVEIHSRTINSGFNQNIIS